ncbi:MAG: HlyD family secretion protein [Acetobacteraceae bacterium]|nr:HlyD family secretion protein [Acetobacteraceae bacterium]
MTGEQVNQPIATQPRKTATFLRGTPVSRRLLSLLPRLLAVILAGVLAAVVMINWNEWVGAAGPQWTDDAVVEADLTPLSAQVAGRISAVLVNDFQRVHEGELLAEIDDAPFRAQLAQADASVAAAEAAIANLKAQEVLQAANIAAAQAQLDGNRATEVRDRLEAERQRKLLATKVVGTQQAVEQADAAEKLAQAQVMAAGAVLAAAQRQLEVQHTQEGQLEANLKAAKASRDLARINLGYTRIASPTDGMVGQRRVYPGQYVGVGTQVISVVPLWRLYVIADYKETQLTHLYTGQRAEVRIDTFPGVVLHGHVMSWSPATGSQFALLPPDNATGNYTKVVQRVPVKIALDDNGGLGDRLRPGMSVETTIHTDAR